MPSTVKCEFCGSAILSSDKFCPSCGASNSQYVEDTAAIITDPKTIAELQEYCTERGMPLLRMRFFIGEDCKEAKAFGIFKDKNGEFVVYKNKSDGSRAERYRGRDEAFAVGEIFQKLLDECHARGIYPDGKSKAVQQSAQMRKTAHYTAPSGGGSSYPKADRKDTFSLWELIEDFFDSKGGCVGCLTLLLLACLPVVLPAILLIYGIVKIAGHRWEKKSIIKWAVALLVISLCNAALTSAVLDEMKYSDGYYIHNDQMYYRYDGDWYTPNDAGDDWISVSDYSVYGDIEDTDYVSGNYHDYVDIEDEDNWDSYSYLDDWDVVSFTDSALYAGLAAESYSSYSSYSSYDNDSDSGYSYSYDDDDDDWDSGYDSWDSGSTDWDSDW